MKRLLVEGWRDIHHSYSIVNQFQIRSLARRTDVELYFSELPLFRSYWKRADGNAAADNGFPDLPSLPEGLVPDAIYRIAYPFPIFPGMQKARTFVFGTTESCRVSPDMIAGEVALEDALEGNDVQIVTSSQWSKRGFVASGAPADRVHVVPLGVDAEIFCPDDDSRESARKWAGIGSDEFVFLNVGAMTGNKGIVLLLVAFATLAERLPNIRLVLKGADFLYASRKRLARELEQLPAALRNLIVPRIVYFGDDASFREMARLYRLADAYVSPYHAEAFNLPALEAMACGVPVVCTQGGPTDDFLHPDASLRVESKEVAHEDKIVLMPELDDLVAQMTTAYQDDAFRARAAKTGPEWVRQGFTWERTTDKLVRLMFDGSSALVRTEQELTDG
jgi:glycosyltransferase involved in cell wall biosynthesis